MITASVVLYKTPRAQIERLLKSALPSSAEKIFVIDNSPDDRWRELEERSEKIRYIHNENLGYGKSHNLAMSLALEMGAKYHVVLNPDISFEPEVLSLLKNFLEENPFAACAMPKVKSPSGELQRLCKLLPSPSDLIFRRFVPSVWFFKKWKEKKNERYCLASFDYEHVINPPCLSGCFMFLRLSVLQKHNIFFDERFFMYFEDFDLVRRLHKVGKTLYFPHAKIIHEHAKESYKNYRMLFLHIKSAARYFKKWGWLFDTERKNWNKEILQEIKNMKKDFYKEKAAQTHDKYTGGGISNG